MEANDPIEAPAVLAALITLAGTWELRRDPLPTELSTFLAGFHATLVALLDVADVAVADRLAPLLDAWEQTVQEESPVDPWDDDSPPPLRIIK